MTALRTLTLTTGHGDTINTFRLRARAGEHRTLDITCTLRLGFEKKDDGIYWAMQRSAVVKGRYTQEEVHERERLAEEPVVKDGDHVLIDGKEYVTKVRGNFSDAAIFTPV